MTYVAGFSSWEEMAAAERANQEAAIAKMQDFQWALMDGQEHYFLSIDPPPDPHLTQAMGMPQRREPIIIVGRITPLEEVDEELDSAYEEEEDEQERADLIASEKANVRALLKRGIPRNQFWDSLWEPDGVGDYHAVHAVKMLPITEEQFRRFRSSKQDFWAAMNDPELAGLLDDWLTKVGEA